MRIERTELMDPTASGGIGTAIGPSIKCQGKTVLLVYYDDVRRVNLAQAIRKRLGCNVIEVRLLNSNDELLPTIEDNLLIA